MFGGFAIFALQMKLRGVFKKVATSLTTLNFLAHPVAHRPLR